MTTTPTLVLTRSDVAKLLTAAECIAAVEESFRMYGDGRASPPSILGVHTKEGGFHIKAGILNAGKAYFAAKTNANYPSNRQRHSLPTIQGVVLLSDADNGTVLALMDSVEITILRTGGATAVAAKYLSREDSTIVAIIGCGNQGRSSLRMLRHVRAIDTVWVYDNDRPAAEAFVEQMSAETSIHIQNVDDPAEAVRACDICVTCTPSKEPILMKNWLRPGSFVAAIGADSEEKQELNPEIIASSKLVTDITAQCETIGELHHALESGLVQRGYEYAELGEIVAGKKAGRADRHETIVFDSTGMALQDVAAAALVYEKAVKDHTGMCVNFLS
jgi:alanine dehydrogenase